jgi:hypothetical protein
MIAKSKLPLLELLYAALNEEVGVVVATEDAEFLRQKLYALRREDPDFRNLAFLISPMNGADLWIVNKKGKINGEES